MIQVTTELSLNNSFLFVLFFSVAKNNPYAVNFNITSLFILSSKTSSMKLVMLGFTVLLQFFCVRCLVTIIIFRLYT